MKNLQFRNCPNLASSDFQTINIFQYALLLIDGTKGKIRNTRWIQR